MKKLLKAAFSHFPFRQQILTILRSVYVPPESIYRHLYFNGTFVVRVNRTNSFKIRHFGVQVENDIFWKGLTGGWEKTSLALWIKMTRMSSVIIDIGANTGVYALVAKSVNSSAKVFAFEPVERVFNRLKKNIEINNFDIVANQLAVSDKSGNAVFYDIPTEHIYSVTLNENHFTEEANAFEVKVKTTSLDDFVTERHLEKIDLMKIDVESHEPQVLQGFRKNIGTFMPSMLVEILSDEAGSRIFDLVKDLPYLFFNIDEEGGVRRVGRITKSDSYNYLFCTLEVANELRLDITFAE